MLVTRDSPSIQGDVPGPDPARAPPNKAIAQAGLACRGQPAGVSLASQGPPRGAPLPPRATCTWSTFGPHAIEACARVGSPTARRSKVGPATSVVRGAETSVCLGRPGGRLASQQWVGQGFHQRPDLGIGVASVTTQGTEVGQATLLGPATYRLWRHMKELGDLRCTEVSRLGWLWHRTLHSWRVSPIWGTTLSPSGATAIQRSTQRVSRRLNYVGEDWRMTPGR
jgi:hypothetical protein